VNIVAEARRSARRLFAKKQAAHARRLRVQRHAGPAGFACDFDTDAGFLERFADAMKV
jgi:hypothetical protein